MDGRPTLRQFLLRQPHEDEGVPHIAAVMEDIAQATRRIAYLLRQGALGGALGSADTENVQGESQKKLDVISNEIMIEYLEWSAHWAGLASEEIDDALAVPGPAAPGGRYLCLFDPLDGSSNIDTNGAVGTIFSILRCPPGVETLGNEHFLQPGTQQVAAGFALYGPSTLLILTTGNGVDGFTLDRGSGEYVLTHPDMRVREEAQDFTINMSNQRYWTAPVQRYIDELVREGDAHRGLHFNMRWMGSMVADVYRLLISGGIFLYPWDSKVPGRPGKLRLLYEVNPISFIIEQAGGVSTTGTERTMEIMPDSLHQRSPAILGSRNEVERVIAYHLEEAARQNGV
jgi:fructose-1,6-bisphosphatase I